MVVGESIPLKDSCGLSIIHLVVYSPMKYQGVVV
jgi:hypothetical protein